MALMLRVLSSRRAYFPTSFVFSSSYPILEPRTLPALCTFRFLRTRVWTRTRAREPRRCSDPGCHPYSQLPPPKKGMRQIGDSFEAHSDPARVVSQMVGSGVGVWLAFSEGAVLRLFHTETQQQLQEVNLNTPIQRALPGHDSVCVTCLEVSPGLLWVGTNLGLLLTLPLPRLEGVPKLTGRGQVAYHGHSGPVSFIVTAIAPQVGSPSQQRCQKSPAPSSNEARGSKDGRTSVCSQLSGETSCSSSSSLTAEEGATNAEPTTTPQPISNVPNRHKSASVAVVVSGGTGCRSLPIPSRMSTGEQKGEGSQGKAQLLAWFMSY